MSFLETRRGILAALTAAPFFTTAGAATADARSSRLAARIAHVRRVSAACSKHDEITYRDALKRYERIVNRFRHTRVNLGLNYEGNDVVFTTAEPRHVDMAKRIVADPISDESYMAGIRKVAAAAERLEKRRAQAEIDSGLTACRAYDDRLASALIAAEDAVAKTVPANLHEMLLKFDFMVEREMIDGWNTEFLRADLVALAEAFA